MAQMGISCWKSLRMTNSDDLTWGVYDAYNRIILDRRGANGMIKVFGVLILVYYIARRLTTWRARLCIHNTIGGLSYILSAVRRNARCYRPSFYSRNCAFEHFYYYGLEVE